VDFTALYPLELHHWAEAAQLEPVPGATTGSQSVTHWARALGAAHLGKVDEVRKESEEIAALHKKLLAEKKKEFAEAVDDDHKQATAWLSVAEGKYDDALAILRPMADKEDSLGEEPQGVPSREMVAEILMLAKRPEQALAEYETDLKFNPNRFNGLYGAAQAAEMAGKQEKATRYYAELVKECEGSNSDRPELSRAKGLVAQK
jgi:tetratricopeptide (TPR) repeat protein